MAHSVQRKILLFGFVAGALSVLAFHQGTLHILHNYGGGWPFVTQHFGRFGAAYNLNPVAPLGVPMVASQAFWGGLWGIVIAAIIRATRGGDLIIGLVFGAVVVTLVAFTVVASLKGLPMMAGGNQQAWLRAGLLNGAFGFGTVFLLRPFGLQG
jgi:hypothetical protein